MPCVVPYGWHSWSLLLIWALGCGIRLHHLDSEVIHDSLMTGVFSLWLARVYLFSLASSVWVELSERPAFLISFENLCLASSFIVTLISIRLWTRHGLDKGDSPSKTVTSDEHKWNQVHPKPWIFPCRTTHARMFPKRHAFGYSYLQCGYPIIPSATTASGIEISDGNDLTLGSWWMRVWADDYLERGNGTLGFYSKLQIYLCEQCVEDNEWSYAYLITAPRFLGYAFNPVSFWYIYNREHMLKWMILEVNNTFGERRMYLLDGSTPPNPSQTADLPRSPFSAESEAKACTGTKSNFIGAWRKDFHVSPFNSRKGSYALKALDPFPNVDFEHPTVDNVITLRSSKDHAKLVARLHSSGNAIDPQTLGFLGTFWFVMSWCWVGFLTFPRILKEAFKLFFKRKLHVWFRPEVLNSSIGRSPTSSEAALQNVFYDYLVQCVDSKEDAFYITFKTAIPATPTRVIKNTNKHVGDRCILDLEIRVLTPAFYSRLVHYSSLSEAIDRECIFTDEKNRTLWISQPQILPILLSDRRSTEAEVDGSSKTNRSSLDELRWKFMKKLRCPPPQPEHNTYTVGSSHYVKDIRSRPYSELDAYVLKCKDRVNAGKYRKTVTKLFLAQRLCLGFPEVIDISALFLRILLCYLGVLQLVDSVVSDGNYLSAVRINWTACSETADLDWWSFSKRAALLCAAHAFGLLKGYS